jgi:hypothetical protein
VHCGCLDEVTTSRSTRSSSQQQSPSSSSTTYRQGRILLRNHSAQPPATLQCCLSYLDKGTWTLAGVCALWLLRCREERQHQPAAVTLVMLSHYIQIKRQTASFPPSQEPQCTASCHFALLLVIPRGRPLHPGGCVCIVVAEMPGQGEAPASSSQSPAAEPLHTDKKVDFFFLLIS